MSLTGKVAVVTGARIERDEKVVFAVDPANAQLFDHESGNAYR